jgi:hypothetical protein
MLPVLWYIIKISAWLVKYFQWYITIQAMTLAKLSKLLEFYQVGSGQGSISNKKSLFFVWCMLQILYSKYAWKTYSFIQNIKHRKLSGQNLTAWFEFCVPKNSRNNYQMSRICKLYDATSKNYVQHMKVVILTHVTPFS